MNDRLAAFNTELKQWAYAKSAELIKISAIYLPWCEFI